jgi:hypothetical protein
MKIKSEKDFFCGLMFVVVGIAFAWASTNYKIGNGARMGPGYFPLLLGTLLALLGAVVIFKSLVVETEDGEKIGKWARKPLFFIITSNLIFGVLLGGLPSIKLPSLGLMPPFMRWPWWLHWQGRNSNSRRSWCWPPYWRSSAM